MRKQTLIGILAVAGAGVACDIIIGVLVVVVLGASCDTQHASRAEIPAIEPASVETFERFDHQGMLVETGTLASGERHGLFTRVHANGVLAERGAWVFGERHGTWQSWFPDGNRFSETHWDHGLPHGQWTFYVRDSGERLAQMRFDQGQLVGDVIIWNIDGSVASVQTFEPELVQ